MLQRQRWFFSLALLHAALLACTNTGSSSSSSTSTSSSSSSSSSGASSLELSSSAAASSAGVSSSAGGSSQASSVGLGSGSSGPAQAAAECATAADCQLVDDCCNCLGIPDGQRPPVCGAPNCLVSTCTSNSYANTLGCVAGRCVAGWDCDPSSVMCRVPTPVCRAGTTPAVDGACWGSCVPTTQCARVGACSQCGANEACVSFGGITTTDHCVEIPAQCNGTPTCACMGRSVCGQAACSDVRGSLLCARP